MTDKSRPAFPGVISDNYCTEGMTLRDYFAGQALIALSPMLIEHGASASTEEIATVPVTIANVAYSLADGMIKQKENA